MSQQLVFLENRERVRVGARIRRSRSGRNHVQAITDHVRNDERDNPRFRGLNEAPTLYPRQMLSHCVHLIDRGSGGKEQIRHPLFVGQADIQNRGRPECGASTRDETKKQVLGPKGLGQGQHSFSTLLAGWGGAVFMARTGGVKSDGAFVPRLGVWDVDPAFEVVTFHERGSQSFDEPVRHPCSRFPCPHHRYFHCVFEARAPNGEDVALDSECLSHQRFRLDRLDAALPYGLCVLDEWGGGARFQ